MQENMEYNVNNKVVTGPKEQYVKLTVTFIKNSERKNFSTCCNDTTIIFEAQKVIKLMT